MLASVPLMQTGALIKTSVTSTHALCWANSWALIQKGGKRTKAIEEEEELITQVNKQPVCPQAGWVGEGMASNHPTDGARKDNLPVHNKEVLSLPCIVSS